jgi:hypothetical protein
MLIILPEITDMQKDARGRHQEVLDMVETLSDRSPSERASTVNGLD